MTPRDVVKEAQRLVRAGKFAQEADGRWIFDVVGLPGCMAYGATKTEAINRAMDLAIDVLTSPQPSDGQEKKA